MFHLGHYLFIYFWSWCFCYFKGQSLRCSPGQGNACCCAFTLYMWEGSNREQWHLLHSLPVFSHSHHYPQSNWPFWCCFPSGWVCIRSRTLWVSPTNSPVRLGVSPAAASTPMGVFNQWFEASFPHAGILCCAVCCLVHQLLPQLPASALPTPLLNPPPCGVC